MSDPRTRPEHLPFSSTTNPAELPKGLPESSFNGHIARPPRSAEAHRHRPRTSALDRCPSANPAGHRPESSERPGFASAVRKRRTALGSAVSGLTDYHRAVTARSVEHRPGRGGARVARAAAFAGSAATFSGAAHALAGGAVPSPLLLLALGLLTAPLAVLAAGRVRGPAQVAAAMVTVQAAMHTLLSRFGAHPASCHRMPSLSGRLGHAGMSEGTGMLCRDEASGMVMDGLSPTMTLCHLGAAVALGLLLSRGERALVQVLAWILPALPGCPRPLPALVAGPHRLRPTRIVRPAPEPLTGAAGRRGPPRSVLAFA